MRGFFFSRVEYLSKNTNTKITPVEIVQLFKDNLHIIEGRELWQEFYAQLNFNLGFINPFVKFIVKIVI
jgi:hypothetical protein